jgi:hypothetical protein
MTRAATGIGSTSIHSLQAPASPAAKHSFRPTCCCSRQPRPTAPPCRNVPQYTATEVRQRKVGARQGMASAVREPASLTARLNGVPTSTARHGPTRRPRPPTRSPRWLFIPPSRCGVADARSWLRCSPPDSPDSPDSADTLVLAGGAGGWVLSSQIEGMAPPSTGSIAPPYPMPVAPGMANGPCQANGLTSSRQ